MHDLEAGDVATDPSEPAQEHMRRLVLGTPFADLPPTSRDGLLASARIERFARRDRPVEQGHPIRHVILLGSGCVRLERVRDGRTLSLGYRGPGETVGESALGGSTAASESAVAADDVEGLVVPAPALKRLVAVDGHVRLALTALLVERRRATEARLASLLLDSVEARLIGFLLDARARWGQPHATGELVAAAFTHADIAQVIGSTRETVTLLLGKLRRAQLINFDRRHVVIRDAAGLAQRAAAR